MKTRKKGILLGLGALFLGLFFLGACGLAVLGYQLLSPNSAINRAAAMDCTLSWARLEPFPASATHIQVKTEGGMFTRSFRVSFTAPMKDIQQWLKQSPGPREAKVSSESPGTQLYQIKPGDGAMWAELTVDETHHSVTIYVSWS